MSQNISTVDAGRLTAEQHELDKALEDLHILKQYAALNDTPQARSDVQDQERKVSTLRRRVLADQSTDWGFVARA